MARPIDVVIDAQTTDVDRGLARGDDRQVEGEE